MSAPLVSIIMPAYNCAKYIAIAVDSVLKQSYTNFELLIADDCSKDDTKAIIDSYQDKRIKRFHNSENMGYLQACNKLMRSAAGELITFQDADDFSNLNRIEKLVKFLVENPSISCVGSNINKISDEGQVLRTSNYPVNDSELRTKFNHYEVVFAGAALMVRKEVIDKIGVYNLYFDRIGSEDTYWYSLILDNFKVATIPDVLYSYRTNPTSVSLNHKSSRAKTGHDLIIAMFRRRQMGKEDYIRLNWKAADIYAEFLLIIIQSSENKLRGIGEFLVKCIAHPIIGLSLSRQFISKLRN